MKQKQIEKHIAKTTLAQSTSFAQVHVVTDSGTLREILLTVLKYKGEKPYITYKGKTLMVTKKQNKFYVYPWG